LKEAKLLMQSLVSLLSSVSWLESSM